MTYNCPICFEENLNDVVQCLNNNCKCIICIDCMIEYFNTCVKDTSKPLCIFCKYYIVAESIINHNKSLIIAYGNLLINYFRNDKSNINDLMKNKTIDNFVKKKKENFRTTIPNVVNIIANILWSDELNNLNVAQNKFIKETIEDSIENIVFVRNCFNSKCVGKLTIKFHCITCDTLFCEKCEKKKDLKSHICKEIDLKSVELISKFTKCPKCFLPVEKNGGCDAMTCPQCETNFNMVTGLIFEFGSDSEFKIKKQKVKISFWDEFSPISENENFLMLLSSIDYLDNYYEKYLNILYDIEKLDIEKVFTNSFQKCIFSKNYLKDSVLLEQAITNKENFIELSSKLIENIWNKS